MKCPRTGSNLKELTIGDLTVDVSEECGGVFFDNYELKKVDEPHEILGAQLVQHLSRFHNDLLPIDSRVSCPKCEKYVMMRLFYSSKQLLEIDECPGCGGIWLDSGELHLLRQLFLSDKERETLFNQHLLDENISLDFKKDKQEPPDQDDIFQRFIKVMDEIFIK